MSAGSYFPPLQASDGRLQQSETKFPIGGGRVLSLWRLRRNPAIGRINNQRRARSSRALLARFDPHRGGQASAERCRDPQYLLEREITRLRAEASERGEPLPSYYQIIPYDKPMKVRYPGRDCRKRAEKRARELAAQVSFLPCAVDALNSS
jgi:hypothetical protein